MNFEEAEKRLDAMAPGKHRSLEYGRSTFISGPLRKEQTCKIYVAGYKICNGNTWEEALTKMEKEMNPQAVKLINETVEELPGSGAAE